MFAKDRDLLALEPTLFRDIAWRGQRLVQGEGDLASGTLTLTSQDVTFEQARVTAGHIVLVHAGSTGAEPLALEVLDRLSATEVSLSRLREDAAAEAILPPDASDADVEVWTFAPQIALVHARLMRAIGIEPGDSDGSLTSGLGEAYTVADIMNTGAVRALEALGTLALIFAAAASPAGSPDSLKARAAEYRDRFSSERQRTPVYLGLDGNGEPSATRRFNTIELIR